MNNEFYAAGYNDALVKLGFEPMPGPSVDIDVSQFNAPAKGIMGRLGSLGTKGKLGLGLGAAALVGGGLYMRNKAKQRAQQGQSQQFYGPPQTTMYGGGY